MNCRDLKIMLSAYADNELALAQREFAREHLSVCPECRATLEGYRAVNRKIISLRDMAALSDVSRDTMLKIKEQPAGKTSGNRLRPALAITAVLAAIAVFVAVPLEMTGTPGVTGSPPPLTWVKLNVFISLYLMVAFLIMLGRVVTDSAYTRLIAGIAPILIGVIGISYGIRESLMGFPEELVIMGSISAAGLIMGAVYVTGRKINRWAAAAGIVLCAAASVLNAIVFMTYPVTHIWLILVPAVFPPGIIIFAFRQEFTQLPGAWMRPAMGMTAFMIGVVILLADQVRGIEIPWSTDPVTPPFLAGSPPTPGYIIFHDIAWLALLAGSLMMLGLALKKRFAMAAAGVGTIAFGIYAWYVGLYALTIQRSDLFLGMGVLPVFDLVMGLAAIRTRADRRWMGLTGIVLSVSALVLDVIYIMSYGDIMYVFWFLAATILIPAGIIVYAFRHAIKRPSPE